MRLELTGRHVDITPALRRLVDAKLARLERLLNDAAVSAQVVLTAEKNRRRADVTLHARGEKFLHGYGTAPAWPAAVSQALDRIVQQAQKVKGKWQGRKRHAVKGTTLGEARVAVAVRPIKRAPGQHRPRMPHIIKSARQPIIPMTVADAARQASNGEGIVIFRDVETRTISVLYRRANGELTLVET
jgi:putative sigma-54 modulation protein